MRIITKRALLSLSMITLLSACGGGDGEQSVKLPEVSSEIYTGTFKDANDTGVYFNKEIASQEYGWNGGHCADYANTRYYETENALIYGEASLPESDFEKSAEWVESAFEAASDLMKTSKAEYFNLRYNYSPRMTSDFFNSIPDTLKKERVLSRELYIWAELLQSNEELSPESSEYIESNLLSLVKKDYSGELYSYYEGLLAYVPSHYDSLSEAEQINTLVNAINQIAELESSTPVTSDALINIELPNDFDLWREREAFTSIEGRSSATHENFIYHQFQKLSLEKQKETLDHFFHSEAYNYYQPLTAEDVTYQKKLYVCLTANDSDIGWGEGTKLGINFTAPSVYARKDAQQIIIHELIHTFQLAYTASPVVFSYLPRWLLEGQAVYLSGQDVEDKANHADYDPASVIIIWDEYGDPGDAYPHYGLAYSYIHENSGFDSILQLFNTLHNDYQFKTREHDSWLYVNFEQAFGENINDHEGNTLSFQRFLNDYDVLMANWNK